MLFPAGSGPLLPEARNPADVALPLPCRRVCIPPADTAQSHLNGSDEPRRCCPVVFANRVEVRTKGGIPKICAFIREQRRENRVHGAVVEIEVAAGVSGIKVSLPVDAFVLKATSIHGKGNDART